MEWLKNNDAGGGAYKLESWKPGQETVFVRFDDWKSGPLPKLKRVIVREVPSAGNRRALLERGDADISFDLPPKDFAEIAKAGKLKVVGIPVENAHRLRRHEREEPALRQREGAPGGGLRDAVRQDLRRRRSSAAASSCYGSRSPPTPRGMAAAYPVQDRLAKAKALMAEAGLPNGFETTLSFDQGFATMNEPTARPDPGVAGADRHQDDDQQDPRRQLARRPAEEGHAALPEHLRRLAELPGVLLLLELPRPERGVQHVMSYQNPEMDKLIDAARFETDPKKYAEDVASFSKIALRRRAARPALPALPRRGDAEEHRGLPVLVPPPARLPPARKS